MNNVMELSTDGSLRLILAVILQACHDSDREFLLSDRCAKLLGFIPATMLSNALGDGLRSVTPKDLAAKLVKRVDSGFFKVKKPKPTRVKTVKSWLVTHPCGFEETIDNVKEFAEDMGILPSGLLNLSNSGGRSNYKGFKMRRIS